MGTGSTAIGVGTSTDGTFDISGIPPGRHQIQATHSDYVTYESGVVTPTDEFFTITLHAGLSLTGYVVDQNNEPIREFSLRLSPATGQHYEQVRGRLPGGRVFLRHRSLSPDVHSLCGPAERRRPVYPFRTPGIDKRYDRAGFVRLWLTHSGPQLLVTIRGYRPATCGSGVRRHHEKAIPASVHPHRDRHLGSDLLLVGHFAWTTGRFLANTVNLTPQTTR